MTFIFYDTETTGTNTTFDQVLQFAAIKADEDLNILETFSIRGRLLPHVVPSPGALLVTGVTIGDITSYPLSHYEMSCQIHGKMADWSKGGAMFVGWNSMRFDEPLLRQTYYQSLLPVYQTNTNGNGRADAMRIAQVVSAAAPDALKFPGQEEGKPSFKLGLVAPANGIVLDGAHEALADTGATLAVAKLIKQRVPAIWEALIANGRKASVVELLRKRPPLLLSERYFGRGHNNVVTPIASNPSDDSELGFFDLQFDPSPYLDADDTQLRLALKTKAIRLVRINSQPGLLPLKFTPADAGGGRLTSETYLARAKAIRENSAFSERVARMLADLHEEKYSDQLPSTYIEERIYGGFPNSRDSKLMAAFHRASWSERAKIADSLEDDRYRELAVRLIASDQPDALADDRHQQWAAWQRERLFAPGDVPWLTVPKAIDKIAELELTVTPEQMAQMNDLQRYLSGLSQ